MNNCTNKYYPLDHFQPPEFNEKITLRECKISKLQWELEKHTSRVNAEKLTKILESNGIIYFQKLLEISLNEIKEIKGIGPKSINIIQAVRASYGIKGEK